MPTDRDPAPTPPPARHVDVVTEAARLQALAHPLRLRLLGLLRLEGPSTASRLGQRCAESSGLTSYHLRQLAAAGFVVDAEASDLEGLSTHGRDRWWKAAATVTSTGPPPLDDDAAAAATGDYQRAVVDLYAERSRAWLTAQHTWPRRWQELSGSGDRVLALTTEETGRLSAELTEVLGRYRAHDPSTPPGSGDVPAGAVVVAVQLQLFPDPGQEPPTSGDQP